MFHHAQQFRGRNKWPILYKGSGARSGVFNIQRQAHLTKAQSTAPSPDGNASGNRKQTACKWRQRRRAASEGSWSCSVPETTGRAAMSWIKPQGKSYSESRGKPEPRLEVRVLGLRRRLSLAVCVVLSWSLADSGSGPWSLALLCDVTVWNGVSSGRPVGVNAVSN